MLENIKYNVVFWFPLFCTLQYVYLLLIKVSYKLDSFVCVFVHLQFVHFRQVKSALVAFVAAWNQYVDSSSVHQCAFSFNLNNFHHEKDHDCKERVMVHHICLAIKN